MRRGFGSGLVALLLLAAACRGARVPPPSYREPAEVDVDAAGEGARDAVDCARRIVKTQGWMGERPFVMSVKKDSRGRWVVFFLERGLAPNSWGGGLELTVSTAPCKRETAAFFHP